MSKITNLKRIVKEDFPAEDQELIEKLAFSINPLLEQLMLVFNKNIDFDNLNQQYSVIKIKVDGAGNPVIGTELKYQLKTRIKGVHCIRAENLTDNTPLTTAPFVSFIASGDLIKITHVTGLVAGKDYNLSIIVYG